MRWAVLLLFFSSVHAQSLVVDNLSGQSPDTLAVEITYSAGADIVGLHVVLQFDSGLPAPDIAEDCGQSVGGSLPRGRWTDIECRGPLQRGKRDRVDDTASGRPGADE